MKVRINNDILLNAASIEDGISILNPEITSSLEYSIRIRFNYTIETQNIIENFIKNQILIFKIEAFNDLGDIIYSINENLQCINTNHIIAANGNTQYTTFIKKGN